MPKFQTIRGMRDFLPSEAEKLRHVEGTTQQIANLYGFKEVITPLVEHYDLLSAKSGDEITARMYAFKDLGGRKVALRPEFTASIARLMATALRNQPKPLRLFSSGTLYRYDEPQFGRYREFWQSNFEIIGSPRPEADVEVLSLTKHLLDTLGLQNYWFKIGHMGILRGLLSKEGVTDEQQNTLMQLLDTKQMDKALKTTKEIGVSTKGIATLQEILETKGKDASKVLTSLKETLQKYPDSMKAAENLHKILQLTQDSGIKFSQSIETGFARGLEYYTGMIFEVLIPEMTIALGGGGRYDKLVELFGGEPTPAIGVAHGLDRIALAIDKQNLPSKSIQETTAIIPIGEEATTQALKVALQLRGRGIAVEFEVMGRTVTRALQDADRRKTTFALILGPKELKDGKIVLRHLKTHKQQLVDIKDVANILSERID
ncbi:MAG: histidine--tRNA ligase [Candidatus Bathyarchaeota archaeon]|nr:MAG: histidine--tRNA ligase [Candidatus Bathyarchaeota archaeon]